MRPLADTDWPSVHAWSRLPESCRYQAWGPNSEEETRAFVGEAAAVWRRCPQTRFPYAAEEAGDVIGMGEIFVRNSAHRQGEIAYIVHPRLWGRGIGTTIARTLIDIGFTDHRLHRIFATCDPRNTASEHILRRVGMSYEGRLRHVLLVRDGWRDSLLFSVLESEWRD